MELFLSYSWEDDQLADKIYTTFKKIGYTIYRDKVDIGIWGSIKEFMQKIEKTDYTILLISDSYLKSDNCMYEVLEVMKDSTYKEKIFPIVVESKIYNPMERAKYILLWQQKKDDLEKEMSKIDLQNMGNLTQDLKRRQNISSNIGEFLDQLADMNNPKIDNVIEAIKQKLDCMQEKINSGNLEIDKNDKKQEICGKISLLLEKSFVIWKQIGPESNVAKKSPISSSIADLWKKRKSEIIKNNNMILNLYTNNKELFSIVECKEFISFEEHAKLFELNNINRLESAAYKKFPKTFTNMIDKILEEK